MAARIDVSDSCMSAWPHEYDRSRGAELCSNVRIPRKFEDAEVENKHRARELLDRALQNRRDRKQQEATQQRQHRQRVLLDQLCNKCFTKELAADPVPGETFWKRHAFSARARHHVEDPRESVHVSVRKSQLYRELARRAPAHVDDSIRAVLGDEAMRDEPSAHPARSFVGIESEAFEVSYDLREPYVMAYNSASAGIQRQEKWSSHGELARSVKFPKVRVRHGHDETELKMANSAEILDNLAGGGAGIAHKILDLRERGAPWDHISQFAAMAQAAAFEMPKEMALKVVACLAEAAANAEEDASPHATDGPTQHAQASAASEHLCNCAMSVLASAAARARDAHDVEFPLCGLEVIAKTGLGWAAFSNMFLVAIFSQLQRSHQEANLQMSWEAADRVSKVFCWAADRHGDLVGKLAPAGRRVARAAHRALSGDVQQNEDTGMLAKLALLESLAARPSIT
ncbi:unnamed protein product [Symbiodinium natans]|uniref:Uncharacterized protein n=1 Tax=Symbiodinium natans TaxID=878477 RepID=A0A812JR37_9DINO|nr:unnamed protein product [Symbiodinium natans]